MWRATAAHVIAAEINLLFADAGVLFDSLKGEVKGNLLSCEIACDRALKLNPSDPGINLLAAKCHGFLGNLRRAAYHLEKAVRLNNTLPEGTKYLRIPESEFKIVRDWLSEE
jgi:hypothetical protein